MATCAIVGINWGDEGKGRMVDLVAQDFEAVVRYQGGNNAGHTVVNQLGEFKLNLLPSGIFRPQVMNVLGTGTVIDLEHLYHEAARVRNKGVRITADNLKINDKAVICFPFHRDLDALEEERLAGKKYGSTRRGIAPVYGDKYQKKSIRMGELLHWDYLETRVKDLLEWKNLTVEKVYNARPYTADEILGWLEKYGKPFIPHICETGSLLLDMHKQGKRILFEAQLGALRDIDYGIYPYTSSSSPLASYAPIGSGAPSLPVQRVIGVVKAYSTCVGEGPFVAEWADKQAEALREAGEEYGAATGRPRRVGPLDLVATRHGVTLQGATELALTKLDVLSYMETIPVCVKYECMGKEISHFPDTPTLEKCKPVYREFPGWRQDISRATKIGDLPKAARDYVDFIEDSIACPITYISVGKGRDEIIRK